MIGVINGLTRSHALTLKNHYCSRARPEDQGVSADVGLSMTSSDSSAIAIPLQSIFKYIVFIRLRCLGVSHVSWLGGNNICQSVSNIFVYPCYYPHWVRETITGFHTLCPSYYPSWSWYILYLHRDSSSPTNFGPRCTTIVITNTLFMSFFLSSLLPNTKPPPKYSTPRLV